MSMRMSMRVCVRGCAWVRAHVCIYVRARVHVHAKPQSDVGLPGLPVDKIEPPVSVRVVLHRRVRWRSELKKLAGAYLAGGSVAGIGDSRAKAMGREEPCMRHVQQRRRLLRKHSVTNAQAESLMVLDCF